MNAESSGNDPTHLNSQGSGNWDSTNRPSSAPPDIDDSHRSAPPHSYPRLSQARNGCGRFNGSWVLRMKTSILRTSISMSCGGRLTTLGTRSPEDFSCVLSGYLLFIYFSAYSDCLCFQYTSERCRCRLEIHAVVIIRVTHTMNWRSAEHSRGY